MRQALHQTQEQIDATILQAEENEPIESILLGDVIILKSMQNQVEVWAIPGGMDWTSSMTEVLLNLQNLKQ